MAFPDVPFAQVEALEGRWRLLTPEEAARAEMLLVDASQLIMDECPRAASAEPATLGRVVCSVVKRAMQPRPIMGAESLQQGGGGYTAQVSFANPSDDLYLSGSERRSLGYGRQQAYTIDMSGGGHVPAP